MAFVYRHIRLDTNQPFYIGIGKDERYYFRATKKSQRNIHWKRIVDKTDYRVEILMDDITYDEAKEKEIEFIKLYGRINLSNGPLCNMTDGGEGNLGYIVTEETRKKLSNSIKEWHKNRVKGEKEIESFRKTVKALQNDPDFIRKRNEGVRNSEKLKAYYASRRGLPGVKHTEESKLKMSLARIGKKVANEFVDKRSKKITQKTLSGEFIKIWDSARQIQRELGLSQGNISRCCNGEYKKANGYKWEYYKQ
jgi:hypothetical protein